MGFAPILKPEGMGGWEIKIYCLRACQRKPTAKSELLPHATAWVLLRALLLHSWLLCAVRGALLCLNPREFFCAMRAPLARLAHQEDSFYL